MATCEDAASFVALELPAELEELEGLLHADLRAIVSALVQRAHERLMLTRREHRALQASLWNGMVEAINTAVEPLTAEAR